MEYIIIRLKLGKTVYCSQHKSNIIRQSTYMNKLYSKQWINKINIFSKSFLEYYISIIENH